MAIDSAVLRTSVSLACSVAFYFLLIDYARTMIEASASIDSQVVYVSEATREFDHKQIKMLAHLAAIKNGSLGVTGYLFFAKGRFVQCLEGERGVVSHLLDQIEQDDRHEILATTWKCVETERRFPDWSMRWISEAETTEIGLEQLLAEQVLLKSKADLPRLDFDRSIWRMVDSVAVSIYGKHQSNEATRQTLLE